MHYELIWKYEQGKEGDSPQLATTVTGSVRILYQFILKII